MSTKFQVSSFPGFARGYAEASKFQVPDRNLRTAVPGRAVSPLAIHRSPLTAADGAHGVTRPTISFRNPQSAIRNSMAFTLVEVLVVMTLLSLIVLSLMTVLNSTQTAFRAGITQAGVLESGRAVSDLIKSDLEGMTPSLCSSNFIWPDPYNATNNVNFYAAVTTFASPPSPLFQSLVGVSNPNIQRTNVLESFFVLSSANVNGSPSWIGTGYVVSTNLPDGTLYPLYRFYMATNVMAAEPASLYNAFYSIPLTNSPPWSHLMDGVVELRVRAFDINGMWMNNIYTNALNFKTNSTMWGETGFYMFSNTLPASVEVELGVLEDRTLQRAESLPLAAQTNYLAQHAGQVHIFRQRAWIRNVDPSAYQ